MNAQQFAAYLDWFREVHNDLDRRLRRVERMVGQNAVIIRELETEIYGRKRYLE